MIKRSLFTISKQWVLLLALLGSSLTSAEPPTSTTSQIKVLPSSEHCLIAAECPRQKQALSACRQAARQGNPEAEYLLGWLYYEGKVVPRKLPKAVYWFRQASAHGEPNAQYQLAKMTLQGEGVPKNVAEAYVLMQMAAANGKMEALDEADKIALQLSQHQKAQASGWLSKIFRDMAKHLRLQNPTH